MNELYQTQVEWDGDCWVIEVYRNGQYESPSISAGLDKVLAESKAGTLALHLNHVVKRNHERIQ